MTLPIVCGIHDAEHTPAVAAVAGMLARRLERPLELLHVSEPGQPPGIGLVRTALGGLDGMFEPGEVVLRLESGDPGARLAQASPGAELLVVGATEEGILGRALGHDVTAAVARDATAPVVVVPAGGVTEGGELHGRGVMCGVRDRRDLVCARAAARLARALGGPLELVHVLQPPIPTALAIEATPPPVPPEQHDHVDALLEECAATLEDELGVVARTRVETGPAGPALAEAARSRGAGLLVVGSSERGPLAAALTGAAARHLLLHAERPVMVCPHGNGTESP